MPVSSKPFSWSYSKLKNFENCPRRMYHTDLVKSVIEPPSDQLEWGNKVHKALEQYITMGTPLPMGMGQMARFADPVRQAKAKGAYVSCENSLAVDRSLRACPNFGPTTWLRGKLDVIIEGPSAVRVIDWKTGKVKVGDDQLRLAAELVMSQNPKIMAVSSIFVWLDEGTISGVVHERKDSAGFWAGMNPRVAAMERAYQDIDYPPNPACHLCKRYCAVRDCEYHGR